MRIMIVSSMPDDEERVVAEWLLNAIAAVLNRLSIPYSLRIETALGLLFHRTHCPNAEHRGSAR